MVRNACRAYDSTHVVKSNTHDDPTKPAWTQRRKPQRPRRLGTALLSSLTALIACAPDEDTDTKPTSPRLARALGDDVGVRRYADQPNWRARVCPAGTRCQTIDVNADGKDDLVRFDPSGVVGPAGSAAIAYSNGWDFSRMQAAGEDVCSELDDCTVADYDGDGWVDIVRFARSKDSELVETSIHFGDAAGRFSDGKLVAKDLCRANEACTAADLDGDGTHEIVTFSDPKIEEFAGRVTVLPGGASLGKQPTVFELGACDQTNEVCSLADVNGDGRADLVELGAEGVQVRLSGPDGLEFGKAERWSDTPCPADARCEMRDVNADLRADLVVIHNDGLGGTVWLADVDSFSGPWSLPNAVCEDARTCWTADVTGDGRVDLLKVSDGGLTELFASQDAVDRMEFEALRLSLVRSQFRQREIEWRRLTLEQMSRHLLPVAPGLRAALPDVYGPVPTGPFEIQEATPEDPAMALPPLPEANPWPETTPGALDRDWLALEMEHRANAVEHEIEIVMGALPLGRQLTNEDEQLRWQSHMGRVVAARTTLYSDSVGATFVADGGRCGNAILHDRHLDVDGTARHEGSYLARYYAAAHRDRLEHALPALTGIEEGLACLSQGEVADLEAAFVEAVLGTMQDLLDLGHPELALMVWDQSLPVEVLLYDVVKTWQIPNGWKLLQARIESDQVSVPEFPAPGTHFRTFVEEDDASCSTLRCQLYTSVSPLPGGTRVLTLHTLGIWAWDPWAGGRLSQVHLGPHLFLRGLVNLNLLGEGDCPITELAQNGMACPSMNTCEDGPAAAALPFEGDGPPPLGAPGSPFTHFGTSRSETPTDSDCDGGGDGGGAGVCLGPVGRGRGGRFSLDPSLDRIFTCTMNTFRPTGPLGAPVTMDLDIRGGCLTGEKPPQDSGKDYEPDEKGGKDGTAKTENPYEDAPARTEEEAAQIRSAAARSQDLVARLLEGDQDAQMTAWGFDFDALVDVFRSTVNEMNRRDGLPELSRQQVLDYFAQAADTVRNGVHFTPNGTDQRMYHTLSNGRSEIVVDESGMAVDMRDINAEHAGDPVAAADARAAHMAHGLLHEALAHVVILSMANDGTIGERWDSRGIHSDALSLQHGLATRLGIQSCDPDTMQCSWSCGTGDARVRRFSECLEEPPSSVPDRCDIAFDYCGDRRNGNLDYGLGGSCAAVDVSLPPMCAAVTCDDGSDLASACCGGGGGGGGGAPGPYYPEPHTPGGHPGDPEWPGGNPPQGPWPLPVPGYMQP